MADPILDQILAPPDPNPPPPAPPIAADGPAPAPAAGVTIDPTEYDRLKRAADAFEQAKPIIDDIQAGRFSQPAPAVPPPPAGDPNDGFWTDPTAATSKLIQDQVTPYARGIAGQLGALAISNFRATKTTDPFYGGAVQYFEREIGTIDKAWLGSLSPEQQVKVLETAWNAATGAYVREYQQKNPPRPTPPANIGGGGATPAGGGGGSGKKSLADIDPVTYRMAVNAGWTQERMDKFADDLLKESE